MKNGVGVCQGRYLFLHVPPRGVMAPSHFFSVRVRRYKDPEKRRVPVAKQEADQSSLLDERAMFLFETKMMPTACTNW